MRLVSAIWAEFHPFDTLPFIDDCVAVRDPADLETGDILVLHGGEDISPALYNKGRSSLSGADNTPSKRDRIEWGLIGRAVSLNIPIIGICRGAQMLCAYNGGYLIQHVNNHGRTHTVETSDGEIIRVNSLHHQMMHPGKTNHKLLAWSEHKLSDVYYDEDTNVNVDVEPEYIYFPDIKGFAIQWHPEMMDGDAQATTYLKQHIISTLNV